MARFQICVSLTFFGIKLKKPLFFDSEKVHYFKNIDEPFKDKITYFGPQKGQEISIGNPFGLGFNQPNNLLLLLPLLRI